MKRVLKSAKKGCTKVHTIYTTATKKCQKKEEKTKNYSLPQTELDQLMKSIIDIELSPINSLV